MAFVSINLSCCLCDTDLLDVKKVKLNGKVTSVSDARGVIVELPRDVYGIDYNSSILCGKDVCICRKCVGEVEAIKSLRVELDKKRSRIIGLLQTLMCTADT